MPARPADIDRFRGCLVGAAIGDALGAPYEHQTASVLTGLNIEGYGYGIYGHEPGTATDDTTLTRFHGEAWLEGEDDGEEYVHELYVRKLIEWYNGDPKDMGGQTASAIACHIAGLTVKDTGSCGNGSLMAVSPSGLVARSPQQAGLFGHRFSTLTHPNELCRYICGQFAASIYALTRVYDNAEYWVNRITVPAWMPIDGQSQGYIAVTAGVAYNALRQSSFSLKGFDTLCDVIKLGGDTDTNASVSGALIGAAFGTAMWTKASPSWLTGELVDYEKWITLADELYELAMK